MHNMNCANESPQARLSYELSSSEQYSDSGSSEQSPHHQYTYTSTSLSSINIRLNQILLNAEQIFNSTINKSRSTKTIAKSKQSNQQIQAGISRLSLLAQKINFLKNNNKDFDKKLELLCYYNLSCGYQALAFKNSNGQLRSSGNKKVSAIDQCLKYLEKSIKFNEQELLSSSKNKNYWFKLNTLQVRMQLQYCALLSQVESNKKALKTAIDTLRILQKIFEKGLSECVSSLSSKKQLGSGVCSEETISFSQNVLIKAKQFLLELSKLEGFEFIISEFSKNKYKFKKIKENNYFWKNNYENNEKIFRKELDGEEKIEANHLNLNRNEGKAGAGVMKFDQNDNDRNILGLKVKNDWISELTIGKIMHMKTLSYADYAEPDNIVFEFNYRSIIEKIVLTSVAYFSIATEMRFLESESEKQKEKVKQEQMQTQSKAKDKEKDKQKCVKQIEEESGAEIKQSEIFHLKAIETVCKYVKVSSLFVDHLINSYHRHYHNDLVTIQEEPSFAEQSMMSTGMKIQMSSSMIFQPEDKTTQSNDYQFKEASSPPKEDKNKKEKQPLFVFKKKKKKSLVDSSQLEKEFCKNLKDSQQRIKEKTLQKMDSKKLEKSISLSNFNSLVMDKKSSIARLKDSITLKINRSPQPSSLRLSKTKSFKGSKKSTRRLFTQR